MTLIATQTVTQAGLTPSFQSASSGGDTWYPTATTVLDFKNASDSPITVTIVTTATLYGQPISNVSVSVPSSGEVICGPFDPGMVMTAGTNTASMTYSSVTSLTVAVIEIQPS